MRKIYKAEYIVVAALVLSLIFGIPAQIEAADSFSQPSTSIFEDEVSITEMASGSNLIVTGSVNEVQSYWNLTSTGILTDISIDILSLIKGDAALKNITLTTSGGQVGDLIQRVSGTPVFEKGQLLLLFLVQELSGKYSIFGGGTGVFYLDDNAEQYTAVINELAKSGYVNATIPYSGIYQPQKFFGESQAFAPSLLLEAGSAPVIENISPPYASAGTNRQIEITGSGFGDTQSSSTLTFFYKSSEPRIKANICSWSDQRIVAVVPVGEINGYGASAGSGSVIVATSSGESNAYQFGVSFGYEKHKWKTPKVHFKVNANANWVENEELAVRAAAKTWSDVSGSDFEFVYDGQTATLVPTLDGVNEILWGDLGIGGPLATASYWYNSSDNIIEFDIVFNSNDAWSTTGELNCYDIESLALHELGHAIGLRDLYGNTGYPNDTSKVMYGQRGTGNIRRNLTINEINGLCWIYPRAEAIKMGEGGFGSSGAAVNENTNKIYVVNSLSNNVSVIDGASGLITASIDTGIKPQALTVNPSTNRVYVSNVLSNSVTVIDGSTDSVVAVVNVGSQPYRLDVNQVTNRIYVANNASDNISVIDGQNNTVIATIDVGDKPSGIGINPNSNMIYVCNEGDPEINNDDNIAVINGATNEKIGDYLTGSSPGGIDVHVTSNRIFVANYNDDNISIINGGTGETITVVPTGNSPRGLVVDPDTGRVYVANYDSDTISIINGLTGEVLKTQSTGKQPFGIDINKNTGLLYVANYGSNSVLVYDTVLEGPADIITGGSGPEALAINEKTGRIYVANTATDTVLVLDIDSHEVLKTISVGDQPGGIAINKELNLIYVSNSLSDDVSIIDGTSNTVVATITGLKRPAGIDINPLTNLAYVVNNGGRSVTVINCFTHEVIEDSIQVGYLPIGVAVNPNTNLIYVANNYSNNISVIDGSSNTVISTINPQAGSNPWPMYLAVLPETNRLYVTNNGTNNVTVVDCEGNTVETVIPVGSGPRGIAVNNTNGRVYVANYLSHCVSVIDGTACVSTLNLGNGPRQIAVQPGTGYLHVSVYWGDNVSVIGDFLEGDANCDGMVNIGDIVTIELGMLKQIPLNPGMDVNKDAFTDVGDIAQTVKIILGTPDVKGDLSGNGVVEEEDLALLNATIAGYYSPSIRADINKDGFIDSNDVIELQQLIGNIY